MDEQDRMIQKAREVYDVGILGSSLEELKEELVATTTKTLSEVMGLYAFAAATIDWPEKVAIGMAAKLLDELMEPPTDRETLQAELLSEVRGTTREALVESLKKQREVILKISAALAGINQDDSQ